MIHSSGGDSRASNHSKRGDAPSPSGKSRLAPTVGQIDPIDAS